MYVSIRLRFNVLLFIWYDTIRYTTQHNIHCVLTETERTNLYWRLNWTQPTKLLHIRCIVYYIRGYMYTKPTVDRWYWNIYSTLFQYILVHQPAVSSVAQQTYTISYSPIQFFIVSLLNCVYIMYIYLFFFRIVHIDV